MNENYQRGYIEVDLDAIRTNVLKLARIAGPQTKIIAAVKADGYGHGAIPVAKELEGQDCIYGFGTATAEEAFVLRGGGIIKPVLVLGYTFPYAYEQMIKEGIEITVFREDSIRQLTQCAGKLQTTAQVHIKVDTGMTRLGISPDEEGMAFVKKVSEAENIEIKGIFTHFAKADETDRSFTEKQFGLFTAFVDRIETELHCHIPLKHCSNSAGLLNMKNVGMDAVRAGIAVYGLSPSAEVSREPADLLPALAFRSRIVWMKEVEAGTPVSYGGIFITKEKMLIANVPIGYGDGYPRSLSNQGYVLVKGQRAPILGRICMDQFMIDISEIPDVREGEAVTLLGRDQTMQITAEEVGELSGRFNYELVCDFGKRIPRVYTREGAQVSSKDYFQDFL